MVNPPLNRKIEPEFLGPLAQTPLAGSASSRPNDLFPGASAYLPERQQQRRRDQWSAAAPLAGLVIQPDEHILYVTAATQVPPLFHAMALGAMAPPYHQVVLVITDKRIVEVLMAVRGKKAETRLRSFPWMSVKDLKISFSKLVVIPASGKKASWRIPVRGDRKLLKPLIERIKPRLMQEGAGAAKGLPISHCPKCGSALGADHGSCASCRATFRSPKLAAALSVAFPGAGLLYAGHPYLAALDFLGEVFLYLIFVLLMLEAEPGAAMVAVGLGAMFFILTKLESVHLSHILTARSKPESAPRRDNYRRFAMVGGLASLILIGGAFPLMGAARSVVDRDLDVAGEGSVWTGSRDASEWVAFADDPAARSQWAHPSGIRLTLFAYPQRMLDTVAEFRTSLRQSFVDQGASILKEDEDVPAPFHGFRFVVVQMTSDGEPVAMAHYFVVDDENRDIHQLVSAVMGEDPAEAEQMGRDLLQHARWIGAAPPEGLIEPGAEMEPEPEMEPGAEMEGADVQPATEVEPETR